MKRAYPYQNQGGSQGSTPQQQHQQQQGVAPASQTPFPAYNAQAYSYQQAAPSAAPPLPPGPPPPTQPAQQYNAQQYPGYPQGYQQPAAGTSYPGYSQPPGQSQQGYPGYNYAQPPAQQPAGGYSAGGYQPSAPATGAPAPYNQAAGQSYGQSGYQPTQPAPYPAQAQNPPAPYAPSHTPYQPPQQPQQPSFSNRGGFGTPSHQNQSHGHGSPPSGPPFKRPRYDSSSSYGGQPPPALPPISGQGSFGGGGRGGDRFGDGGGRGGRGFRSRGRGSRGFSGEGRGGFNRHESSSRYSDGGGGSFGGSHGHSHGHRDSHSSGPTSDVNSTPINPNRFGSSGGAAATSGMLVNNSPTFNMGSGGPRGGHHYDDDTNYTPRGSRARGRGFRGRGRGEGSRGFEGRGGFSDRGGRGVFPPFAARGSSGGVMLGGRGNHQRSFSSYYEHKRGSRGSRRGGVGSHTLRGTRGRGRAVPNTEWKRYPRAWGGREGGFDGKAGDDKVKRTLTDFRIAGLVIEEIGWEWKAEQDRSEEEEKEEGNEEKPKKKKGDKKHGRDEGGDDDDLLVTDLVGVAKKVKSEDGAVAVSPEDLKKSAKAGKPIATADGKTDPDADLKPTLEEGKVASWGVPPGRENSRLRLYFASPVSGAYSTEQQPQVREKKSSKLSQPPTAKTEEVDGEPMDAMDDDSVVNDIEAAAAAAAATAEAMEATEQKPNGTTTIVQEEKTETEAPVDGVNGVATEVGTETTTVETTDQTAQNGEGGETGVGLESVEGGQGETVEQAENGSGEANGDVEKEDETGDNGQTEAIVPEAAVLTNGDGEAHPVTEGEDQDQMDSSFYDAQDAEGEDDPEYAEGAEDQDATGDPDDQEEEEETEFIPPEPTPDRVSISYAKNTRRIVIDAEVVESIRVIRGDGKVEMLVKLEHPGSSDEDDEFRICKGVLVEALDPMADDYIVIDRAYLKAACEEVRSGNDEDDEQRPEHDDLLPPLHRLLEESSDGHNDENTVPQFKRTHIKLIAHLDRVHPLTEARWVKSGDIEGWITQMMQNIKLAEGDTRDSLWRNKIEVVDPDPPPTIQHALDTWLTSTTIGTSDQRNLFISNHMQSIDNVLEILLRLARQDLRQTISQHHPPQPPSVSNLAAQLSSPYPEQQNQISLAVLGIFRMACDIAAKNGGLRAEVETKTSEIIRGLPYHMVFKSLDSMFKQWLEAGNGKASSSAGKGPK